MNLIKVHADERWMPEDGPGGESMWGIAMGYGRAVLANNPFYTEGLALYDLVKIDNDNEIEMVLQASGMKNFRVILPKTSEASAKRFIKGVKEFTPHVERAAGPFFSINLPDTMSKLLVDYFDENGIVAWENGN